MMKTYKQYRYKNEISSVVNLTRIQMPIQIQLFTSIRIQGAKQMRIQTHPGQTLPSQKRKIFTVKVYFM